MNLTSEVAAALGPTGPLTKLPNYELRIEQARFAQRIAYVLERRGRLVAEAGTGVGKSMAYLIPAIISGDHVIVSTFTKVLQDQLLKNDIPFLNQHLKQFTGVKLKGRVNYLCLWKHSTHQTAVERREIEPLPDSLRAWVASTQSGDLDEYTGLLPVELRRKLTASRDDCLHRKCPTFKDCWAEDAKEKASLAQIVVVNHALLMVDLETRGVLPAADHIIIDEAHHLADAAASMQEVSLTINRINSVLRANVARVDLFPQDLAGRVSSMFYTWLEGFADRLGTNDRESYEWPLAYSADVLESLGELVTWWKTRGQAVKDRVSEMTVHEQKLHEISLEQISKEVDKLWQLYADFDDLANAKQATDHAYWIQRDRTRGNFTYSLHSTPVDVAPWLASRLWRASDSQAPSVIAVSATLSQGTDFSHFLRETGCTRVTTHVEGSPFDYKTQAMYYVPQVPPPNGPRDSEDRQDVMAWEIKRLVQATSGGVFVLFTSWARCRYMYNRLLPEIENERPVYVQGEYPTLELISMVKRDGNAVLFGTKSFWEGVDVPGDALMVVIIDRLPFPTPADPLYKAKSRYLEAMGLRPFFTLAVPGATLALKQGMGRLIRSKGDRGVIVFLDNRIVSKGYGKIIRDSLPDAPLTRNFEEVSTFLDDLIILF